MRIVICVSMFAMLASTASAQTEYVTEVSSQPASKTAPATGTEVLTNDTIVQLVSIGLGEEAIIAKIRTSKSNFDTSTDALIHLKSKGVPNPVIAAMLGGPAAAPATESELSMDSADPRVPHYPGLYMVDAKNSPGKMSRINPTVSNQAKTGGILGYALTGGIASVSIKAAIPGESAKIQTSTKRPVFYAYFDESLPRTLQNNNASHWSTGNGSVTVSPQEVTLVRFMEKEGRREARVGSMNIAGAKQGVMDKDQIPFEAEMISPGLFKITVGRLDPGEYGFIQSMSNGGARGAISARVFDFGVE